MISDNFNPYFRKSVNSDSDETYLSFKFSELSEYYNRLAELNVNMPKTLLTLHNARAIESGQINIDSQVVNGSLDDFKRKNAFTYVATSSISETCKVYKSCLGEMIKIMQSTNSNKPVGYDSSFENFIYDSDNDQALLCDIYPPRLAYRIVNNNPVFREHEELLVNYPEGEELSFEKESLLKFHYYNPSGMVQHCFAWAIGSFFAIREYKSEEMDKLTSSLLKVSKELLNNDININFLDDLLKAIKSNSYKKYLDYRIMRAKTKLSNTTDGESISFGRAASSYNFFPKNNFFVSGTILTPTRSSELSVVIAAGGKGSRMEGQATKGKLMVVNSSGKPLIEELLDRIALAHEIRKVVLAGSHDTLTAQNAYEYLRNNNRFSKTDIMLTLGERIGVANVLYRGVRQVIEKDNSNVILTVGDVVLENYEALINHLAPVVLGVSNPRENSKKSYSGIGIDENGHANFSSNLSKKFVLNGVYHLIESHREKFCAMVEEKVRAKEKSEGVFNSNGEMRLSWLWKQMQKEGIDVGAAHLGNFAEVNLPEDLKEFRSFS